MNTSVRIGLTNVESSGDEEAASGENNNLRGRDVDYFYYGPGSLSSSSANRRTESSDDEATPLRRNRPGSLFLCSSSNRRSESSDDATTTPLRRNRSRLSPVVEDDPDPIVNISACMGLFAYFYIYSLIFTNHFIIENDNI